MRTGKRSRSGHIAIAVAVLGVVLFRSSSSLAGGMALVDARLQYDRTTGILDVCGHLFNYGYSSAQTGVEVVLFEIEFGGSKSSYFWNPPKQAQANVCIAFTVPPNIPSTISVALHPLADFTKTPLATGNLGRAIPALAAPPVYTRLAAGLQRIPATKVGDYTPTHDLPYASTIKTYLLLNGRTPGVNNVASGPSNTPLIFSWTSNNIEPGTSVQYRHRLYPTQVDWSNWSPTRQTEITFIPAGIHSFELEVQAIRGGQQLSLPTAHYQFILESSYVGPPMTKGGPAVGVKPGAPDAYTRQRALVLGVSTYGRYFQGLAFVKEDVSRFQRALVNLGFRPADIASGDPDTTSAHIMSQIRTFLDAARDGEQTIIYLSGHGFAAKDSDEDHSYFAGSDCRPDDTTTCVDLSTLKSMLIEVINRHINAPRHILLILDACAAGRAVVAKGFTYEIAAAQGRAVHVITAGTRDEEAREDATQGVSLFTRYLIEGLNGQADIVQDGVITLSELMVWVRWHVAKDSGGAQTPSFARVKGTGEMMFSMGHER